MKIPRDGIRRVGGKIQKPLVIPAIHPLQIYKFNRGVTAAQLKATVVAARIGAEKILKHLKRRGAISVLTRYSFERAGAKEITTTDLPPEITEWMIESDASTSDVSGTIQEYWLFSRAGERGILAHLTLTFDRLFWLKPLAPDDYIDLLLSSVDRRRRTHGDVQLEALLPAGSPHSGLSGVDRDKPIESIQLRIRPSDENLLSAFEKAQKVKDELSEVVEELALSFASEVNATKALLSGRNDQTLNELISEIDRQENIDAKGRVLELLVLRLLNGVPGFSVKGRTRTLTEEIDIIVINNSENALWKRDGPLILCECKNWSGKCGKNEFVIFHQKLQNRRGRCTLGLLVSWNGFAETITKEELRGSREDLLLLPITGKDLREAALGGKFEPVLERVWTAATTR